MTHFVLYKDSSLVRSNAKSMTAERGGDEKNRGRQRLRERQKVWTHTSTDMGAVTK